MKSKQNLFLVLWKAKLVSIRTISLFTHINFVSWLQGPVSAFYHGNWSVTKNETVTELQF
jgi:hypothetical protein